MLNFSKKKKKNPNLNHKKSMQQDNKRLLDFAVEIDVDWCKIEENRTKWKQNRTLGLNINGGFCF